MPDTPKTKRFCPYLGAETDAEFSPDHIFPEMIGGKRDFMIEVSKERNSYLGSNIEQPGFDNFLFRAMRQSCGIKGKKGGIPSTVIEGDVTNASTPGLRYKLTKQPVGSILH